MSVCPLRLVFPLDLIFNQADSETLSSFCYVRVCKEGNSPMFGIVTSCLSHNFLNVTTQFDLISLFEEAQQDFESSLWWVSTMRLSTTKMTKLALPLKSLSAPLLVAISSSE